jgi:hypothetical protein
MNISFQRARLVAMPTAARPRRRLYNHKLNAADYNCISAFPANLSL